MANVNKHLKSTHQPPRTRGPRPSHVHHKSAPKPVFNVNGKRTNVNRSNSGSHEPITQQHEEIARYLSDAWNKIRNEFERKPDRENAPLWYKERNPNPKLQGFKAFDLEEYWGKRTLEKLDLPESS